ncbi:MULTISPECIES: mannose-1-phosphate guanylyltransferase/mannose-6-phosphate isomerase [Ramlibacter]|uniref:mannose-1-phosphate guanylyltransferase n=1 Tax=Ramlibacter pinisoli TaxID=2682844 RepID=A0A6N8ISI2_9BURK|nr:MULTISPECIES: mannose-1-phosphate guanylyltransferase/mannose-6-phosphate isomerase [Ramlibacter]MBA2964823.1 mannose-1-phosphate guanylyltransferase/mannose-6-phosphate isomerase [Ramlibacter sp. CGMCC 1.13660]MVQ29788.1 mannose-1-phosphate guanylyltransferase/mannose-6-phosphate isomerase [Ramlibacter pinisoli]
MTTPTIQPVVLCGGSGTRLWPLSRKSFPKQFVPLIGGQSLLALTLARVAPLADGRVTLVAAEEHRFMLREALHGQGLDGTIVLEPCARNTAAAMALAALGTDDPAQLLLFCPADHHIPDGSAFERMVRGAAATANDGAIVTFGVQPSFPSTAYGYLEMGTARPGGGHTVGRFLEKPDAGRAQELLLAGNVLWNAGIFLCRVDVLLAALERHAPDILASCREAMAGARPDEEFLRPDGAALETCRSESIDYAVMERHDNLAVFPFTGQWSDVGSWNAVAQLTPADGDGNRVVGNGVVVQGKNTFVQASDRCVVALGTEDLLVIDTPDALLVAGVNAAEQVKTVVAELEKRGADEIRSHRLVLRPWGSYDTVERGARFQVKRILVNPGASLSLQKHFHRAEHWIVVKGTTEVTRGKEVFLLTENQSTYIPLGEVHRLHNPGKVPLEMIEVQSGSYLGEDDIVRIEDTYGRVVPIRENPGR